MLTIDGQLIRLTRGDDATLSLALYQPNGELYMPIEGQKVLFSVSKKPTKGPNPTPIFQREFQQSKYGLQVEIKSDDTRFLGFQKYAWDCQFIFETGEVNTVCSGLLELIPEVG